MSFASVGRISLLATRSRVPILLSTNNVSNIFRHGGFPEISSVILRNHVPASCLSTTSRKLNPSDKNTGENGNLSHPPHFKNGQERTAKKEEGHFMKHPIWTAEEVESVEIYHKPPEDATEKLAYTTVQCLRITFDFLSGYKRGVMDENKWLTRIILLETVAAVPGMVAAMTRHFHSLRKLQRDHGWIHTLLEEAENERMHLMTALELKKPGSLFRGVILVCQGIFVNTFFIWYLISPRFCHKFVAYLEEEAVKTYTFCLECIDDSRLPMWQHLPAPPIAKRYWRLPEGSMMRDVILAIRADEAHHRVVNHMFGELDPHEKNPLGPGEHKL